MPPFFEHNLGLGVQHIDSKV